MKRAIGILVGSLLSVSAYAADLPVKAPINPFINLASSGWYIGVGTEASVAQANVDGNIFATSLVSGNLKAAGGAVGGAIGYIRSNCIAGTWCRLEASAMYQNITGADAAGGSIASRWSATQEADVGFELIKTIFSYVGNLGISFPSFNPTLPASALVAATPRQYVGIGVKEYGIDGSFFTAHGSSIGVAPMIKSGFLWQTVDASGKPNGGALDAYVAVAFTTKGFTIDNAFANSGAPTIGAATKLGTTYTAGLKYDFAISNF